MPVRWRTKPIGPDVGGWETRKPKLEILFEYKEMVGTAHPIRRRRTRPVAPNKANLPRSWAKNQGACEKQSQCAIG